MLTPDEITEFKNLVLEVFGRELTDGEALDQGSRLIQLFELRIRNKRLLQIPKIGDTNE